MAKSTYSLAHISFLTLSGTWCVSETAADKKVFLLGDEVTAQGNNEPVTCWTAVSTVCCTDWSALPVGGVVSAMSELPWTAVPDLCGGSGMNCTTGIAADADGGTWATFCKALATAAVIVFERVARVSWVRTDCIGTGTAGELSWDPDWIG